MSTTPVSFAGNVGAVAAMCWLAAHVTAREPRAQLAECAVVAVALIVRWALDHFWFRAARLERAAAMLVLVYASVRAIYGCPYLLPLAAAGVVSLLPGSRGFGHAWLTAVMCYALKDFRAFQAMHLAAQLLQLNLPASSRGSTVVNLVARRADPAER